MKLFLNCSGLGAPYNMAPRTATIQVLSQSLDRRIPSGSS